GYRRFDPAAERAEVIGEIGRGEARAHPEHSASDVHSDGVRGDRVLHRDDGSHGRALAQMDVRHHPHPFHPGQGCDVLKLTDGGGVDVLLLRPHEYGHVGIKAYGKHLGAPSTVRYARSSGSLTLKHKHSPLASSILY